MRIISIYPHYQDGLGYQDYYLGKSLQKLGHEVIYIAGDWHFPFPDYDNTVKHVIGDKYVGHGKFKTEFGADLYRLKTKSYFGKYVLPGANKLIKSLKPDLIICHGIFNLYSTNLAKFARKNNYKIVFDDHTTANVRNHTMLAKIVERLFVLRFSKIIEKSADKIIAISDSVSHFLKDIGFKNIELIPLGADLSVFYPDKNERVQKRNELGIKEDEILIIYTGKIYDLKKLEIIPQALKNSGADLSKVVVLYVGSVAKNYENTFQEILNDKSVKSIYQESVLPHELRSFYNAADIGCWPGHTSGSTVDASACGCPVICNDIMPERYAYGNGLGIKDGNLKDLTEAFKILLNNKDLRIEMGQKGIEYVGKELTWEAHSLKIIS